MVVVIPRNSNNSTRIWQVINDCQYHVTVQFGDKKMNIIADNNKDEMVVLNDDETMIPNLKSLLK